MKNISLLAAMAVEGARALAGRDDIVGVAEVLRAEQRPDAHRVALELVALREMLELQLADVDDSRIDDAHGMLAERDRILRSDDDGPASLSCHPCFRLSNAPEETEASGNMETKYAK
jgi:hypothetical protein